MHRDHFLEERAALRQMLYPAPRPWPGAVAEQRARFLAACEAIGRESERLRRDADRPVEGAPAVVLALLLAVVTLAFPLGCVWWVWPR